MKIIFLWNLDPINGNYILQKYPILWLKNVVMNGLFEIVALISLGWILLSIGFAVFWSVLKRREPQIEEAEDALAGDS